MHIFYFAYKGLYFHFVNDSRKFRYCRWKFCVHADKRQMLEDLTQSLQNKPNKDHVLWELASCISSAVGADGFHLYIPDIGHPDTLGNSKHNGHYSINH